MDNIQKTVAAVLGIAAFAVLLIPEGGKIGGNDQATNGPVPLGPIPIAEENNATQPIPEQNDGVSEVANSTDDEFGDADEYENFGQPMNDARPLGSNINNSDPQTAQNNLPTGAVPPAPAYSDASIADNGGQATTPRVDSARPSQ